MTVYQPKCPQVIEYRIDHHDRILQVSDSWRRFAVENNAPVKVLEAVGDSLWDHIYDSGTQDLYSLLLDSVRLSQQPLSFPYRCDSPSVKRFMAMTMVCEPLEEVLFHSEVVALEPLSHEISVTNWSALRIREVHICSSCRKVKVGAQWHEITDAFGGVSPSTLSWVFTAYSIGVASLLLASGWAADLFGRKRLFLIGMTGRISTADLGAGSTWRIGAGCVQCLVGACGSGHGLRGAVCDRGGCHQHVVGDA